MLATAVLMAAVVAVPEGHLERGRCSAVGVRSTQVSDRRQAPLVFSATQVTDLELYAQALGSAPRALRFELYTPSGHLYQSLTAEPLTQARRRGAVRATLPVAGTFIMTSALFGAWRVEPHFAGDSKPCGPPTRFVIRP